ncbi:hypothetical protein [Streptomyces cellostaticus]|uniref:hypothetical protein n=1 Tax=Streptomyces TaxID=1883 RepID=UPI002026D7E4|nr:hypothetical protein [Streptomyces cellostaticus]
MRLCACLSLSLGLAAGAVLVPVPSAAAQADATCAAPGGRAFPLATRIHGGPSAYEAGGGFGTWYLDLTNSTTRTCGDLHPVVVLVDDKRALKPSQPKLEFYDGTRTLPVGFESTDAQELVGVLDAAGFDGFTVPPGRTVTVKLRLSLTSDALPDRVTANAAVVQRRGEDGEWVGESNDYRFSVTGGGNGQQDEEQEQEGGGTPTPGDGDATAGPDSSTGPGGTASPDDSATPGAATPVGSTDPAPRPRPTGGGADPGTGALPFTEAAQQAGERARELARTGTGLAHGLLAAVTALLVVGGAAYLLARRRR